MAGIIDILSFLKKRGVEVSAEAAVAVEEKFVGQVLAAEDQVVKSGHIAIPKAIYDEKTEDLKTWKEKARAYEAERDELRKAMDAGDSQNKSLAEKYKREYEAIKPLADGFSNHIKSTWEQAKDKIPDALKEFYVFPEKDKELTLEQLMANVEKVTEHVKLKVLELDKPPQMRDTPRGSPTGKDQTPQQKESLDGLNPGAKMEKGYTKSGPQAQPVTK